MRALRRVSSICEPSTRRPCVGKQALSAVSTTWKWRGAGGDRRHHRQRRQSRHRCPAARRHTRGGRSPKIRGARGVIPMMREFDSNERVAPVNGEALALRQAKGALHGQRLFARKAIRATIRKRRWRRLPRSRMRVKRAPGERIAHALNLRIRSIQLRQPLIDGIAPEVVELLKDRHVPRWRRVRSIEAATGAERHASRSRVGERRSSAPPRTPA